jgi:ribosomal protein L37AE/L43A
MAKWPGWLVRLLKWRRKCPACGSTIPRRATVCPVCRTDLVGGIYPPTNPFD